MPIPFPNNNTNWEAAGRPMIFTTNARAFTPIVTDGVTTPTLTITEPTVENQLVLLSCSEFATFGNVGNQTRQTYRTFEPNGDIKNTFVQTENFGNVTISLFGNQTAANYDVGVPNVIGTGATNSQGTTWPPTSTAAPTYSATCAQAAADSTNTVNNSFVSDQSDAVDFQIGNVHEPVTTNNVTDTGDLTPTFNINTPTSVCGATHSATRWKLWQQASAGFEGDSPTDDPRTTAVFNNGADCDLTFTEGDGLTQVTFPNNLELVDDNDTVYTLGVQCTFTLDGETFRSPYVLTQFTLQAAINVNIVAANNGTATNNQIDLDDQVELIEREMGDFTGFPVSRGGLDRIASSGAVDQDPLLANGGPGLLEPRIDRVVRGHVDIAKDASNLGRHSFAFFGVKIEQGDLHTMCGECPCGRRAKAGRAARDHSGDI